jgi:hypothetical protein
MGPTKSALRADSKLHAEVKKGLGALEKSDKALVDKAIRASFADSLEIDKNLRTGRDQEHRWDYLLGHGDTTLIVGLEPHSAHTKEVSTVVAKKAAAKRQLRDHLKPGTTIAAWFWVASGKVDFVPHEKTILRLDQEGITFVGGMLRAKNLSRLQKDKVSAKRR